MSCTRIIGLTGGIASGKSTVGRLLGELGAAVVDADRLSRRVVEPGQPAYQALVTEFGRGILAPDGTIDRKLLGEHVFRDEAARRRLNAITHPHIAALSQAEITRHAEAGAGVVIYEAALLVENRLHEVLDGIIVVTVPPELQLSRLMARDGLTDAAARARLAAQLPLADKIAAADWVIDNSGSLAETAEGVRTLWDTLSQEP